MLKINNKVKIPLLLVGISMGGIFLYQYLTFIPEYSKAEKVETPVYGDKEDTRTLSDITYMQEMTSGICGRSIENETKQLVDKRDGKSYWVAKLKDDNCWMTQNLDLDIPAEGLTADLSDVLEDWSRDTTDISAPVATTDKLFGGYNLKEVASYDPGFYVLVGGITNTIASEDLAMGVATGEFSLEDAHYLRGNYYSWNAATAGSGKLIEAGNAKNSICAKNWMLPVNDTGGLNASISGSYGFLLKSYGITSDVAGGGAILREPLYFVRGGAVNTKSFYHLGNYGNYWSATVYGDSQVYELSFHGSFVNPMYYTGVVPINGFSVRCVARDNVLDVKVPEIDDPNVAVKVPKILTMEVSGPVNVETKSGEIMTGEFITTVSSNSEYKLSLSAEEPNLINTEAGKENYKISALASNEKIEDVDSGWGIKCSGNGCSKLIYTGLTTKAVDYYTGNSGTNLETLFEVGIKVDPSLPSGTYSTNVTVTASQN